AAEATIQIEKITPFATSNQLTIECVLKATENIEWLVLSAAVNAAKTASELWQGSFAETNLLAEKPLTLRRTLTFSNPLPSIWSPQNPQLYTLSVSAVHANKSQAESSVRFGFRSFESRNGNFYLNGRPLFLRGIAINPPGRTIPAEVGESRVFAEAYVRFLKTQN